MSGKTSGVGPLIQGQGGAGGSGPVELTREPLDRDSPNHLEVSGRLIGTASVSDRLTFAEGAATASGGCGLPLVGQGSAKIQLGRVPDGW